MSEVILYASLPLPVSINKMYYTDAAGHRKLSQEAKEWKELVFEYLDYGQASAPQVVHLNVKAIQALRELYSKKKSVAIDREKLFYQFDVFYAFPSLASDIDGCIKLTMDTVFDWLSEKRDGEKGNSFNDNRVISLPVKKIVTPLMQSHVEFGLMECRQEWQSGDLIEMYRALTGNPKVMV